MPFNFHPSAHRFEKLRAALAQPIIPPEIKGNKAEPVAGMYDYTAPPQRKPLTDEEMRKVLKTFYFDPNVVFGDVVRAIEKAHGIGGEA